MINCESALAMESHSKPAIIPPDLPPVDTERIIACQGNAVAVEREAKTVCDFLVLICLAGCKRQQILPASKHSYPTMYRAITKKITRLFLEMYTTLAKGNK